MFEEIQSLVDIGILWTYRQGKSAAGKELPIGKAKGISPAWA